MSHGHQHLGKSASLKKNTQLHVMHVVDPAGTQPCFTSQKPGEAYAALEDSVVFRHKPC